MLQLTNHIDYKFKYYKNNSFLTKKFLLNIIKNNVIYSEYLPDGIDLNNISKSFLFCISIFLISQLIANLEHQVYSKLYNEYKLKEMQKANKKWEEFKISLSNDTANKINSFNPTNR